MLIWNYVVDNHCCMFVNAYFVTFVQVVRLCAKSREAVSSPVEHLTLHYQVRPVAFFVF